MDDEGQRRRAAKRALARCNEAEAIAGVRRTPTTQSDEKRKARPLSARQWSFALLVLLREICERTGWSYTTSRSHFGVRIPPLDVGSGEFVRVLQG